MKQKYFEVGRFCGLVVLPMRNAPALAPLGSWHLGASQAVHFACKQFFTNRNASIWKIQVKKYVLNFGKTVHQLFLTHGKLAVLSFNLLLFRL